MIKNLSKESACNWDWVDVTDPSAEDLQKVAQQYNLHPALVQDSLQPDHLPKYELIQDTVFAIIRVFNKEVGVSGDTVQDLTNKIAIFYNSSFLITIHRTPYSFLDEIEKSAIAKGECAAPFNLFILIIKEALTSFEQPGIKLAADLDYFESKVFLRRTQHYPLTNGMYWLKRKAEVSKRVLNLSKIVLDNLSRENQNDPYIQDIQDMYLRLQTMYEEIDNSTNNLLNIHIGLASQRTNEVMRVLTIFSVFFLPLTFIVGIYGMNFRYMPELESHYGYPMAMLVMLIITLGIYFWFKKKEWL